MKNENFKKFINYSITKTSLLNSIVGGETDEPIDKEKTERPPHDDNEIAGDD